MPEGEEVNYFTHLNELRRRLIVVVLSIAGLTVVSFFASDFLLELITRPVKKSVASLYFLTPYEAFLMRLRVSVTSGIVLSVPIVLTQLWRFVVPGLYRSERRAIFPIVLVSIVLFSLGVLFAHFLVIPFALRFFLGFQTETLQPLISIGAYVSFFLSLILVFGAVFVTPVVLVGLMYLGVVDVDTLRRQRKTVIVLAFVLAAVITPTMDIVTQCLLALPLWGLFEISVLIGRGIKNKR
ncbi:MAG: twin arginine-targeting protein translocase TatC [Omnitrophica bacterium RIFCSPLOWO2_12_FULL_50_11]|nr:MAG: twin arginine-targeting protein translocase TatC [Omnitrophica bacterium RIFCSPLOWO2_12_FULL_50_11]